MTMAPRGVYAELLVIILLLHGINEFQLNDCV